MYSVRVRHSFEDIVALFKLVKSARSSPTVGVCALVAAQCDVEDKVVAREEGLFMAGALDCALFESSARTGWQVSEATLHVASLLAEAGAKSSRRCSLTRLADRCMHG